MTQFTIIAAAALLVAGGPSPKMAGIIEKGLARAQEQAELMYDALTPPPSPRRNIPLGMGKDGQLIFTGSGDWTSGFFPGELWYLYEYTGKESFRTAAEDMTERLRGEQFNTSTHDVGFMIGCSFGNAYRLTGREDYRAVLENAALSLCTRFNPEIGCLRSWDNSGQAQFMVIIDNMMNLELLTSVTGLTGRPGFARIADIHAHTTMANHFRPDGSTWHLLDYDTTTFQPWRKVTVQGLADDSAWARGQSWGLYGFTMMYRQTGNEDYLGQAETIAAFLMSHPNMPADKIPYWDYNAAPGKDTPRDASAGAIMASALIELYTLTGKEGYLRFAEKQLTSLTGTKYLAKKGTNALFTLMHSTGDLPKGRNIDKPIPYADYYYVEALMRLKKLMEGKPITQVPAKWSPNAQRQMWLSALDRVCRPVLTALAEGRLKKDLPVESSGRGRGRYTHLEALGRVICGIAPWLELEGGNSAECRLREEYRTLAVKAISNAVDPSSPDFLNFCDGDQPLVDAAFLAQGLVRAPHALWDGLDAKTQQNLVHALKSSRVIKPYESNWLLFSAMVEAALLEFTGEYESAPIDYALSRFVDWYVGDGWYSDGTVFHLDYYNSFVIHPMLSNVLDVLEKHGIAVPAQYKQEPARYARYAALQERLIAPDGSYPAVGRSLAYRFGAFHALSDAALRHILPAGTNPAAARCALTKVISRQIAAPGTFDGQGWLKVGFNGAQPGIGEGYISTGSLYLCTAGLVALGLPESDPFWAGADTPWTSVRVWNGENIPADHALDGK